MKHAVLLTAIICLGLTSLHSLAAEGELPVIGGQAAVATVNDEPITLEDLNRAIAEAHASRHEEQKAGRIDYSAIINRIINTRLILLEARNIGLDQLPEVKNAVNTYKEDTLMELLMKRHVKDIEPDEDEVARVYREMAKEWKITSVRFNKEDAANRFREEILAGKDFDEVSHKAVEEGLAKEIDRDRYLKDQELTGAIARLIARMEVGSLSPVVSIGKKGFVVFKLQGMRFPEDEDPELRKRAEEQARKTKKLRAAKEYYESLKKSYVSMNADLLEALDYESQVPGFEELLTDNRIIAEIDGQEPVTVGELGRALKKKFYHGVDRAIEDKRVNTLKKVAMDEILQGRVLLAEAVNQNIDTTEEYRRRVREYENSAIFGAFVSKVIVPNVRLDRKELKNYYQENTEDFTFPEMMRIKSLTFRKKSDAVHALEKLKAGTDFNWLSSHAEGKVDKNTKGLLKFEGALLTTSSLPEDLRQTISGATPGDFRLYESSEGHFYVLYIYHVIPPEPQPFEDVKRDVAKRVYEDKVRKAVEDYAERLKEYYPVKIYAKDLQ
jgi:hypothetical protein